MSDIQRKMIVVLGSGRCGTSLLMQVLMALGMKVSQNLIPPKAHNPVGPMEDVDIARVYDEIILPGIHSSRVLPVSEEQLESESIAAGASFLKKIVEKNLSATTGLWGFKDPFTNCVLPVWFRIFQDIGVTPIFLVSVRNPAQAVVSRRKYFGAEGSVGELAWLTHLTEALYHTAADCYIVHYEDWFVRGPEIARDLLGFTGLDRVFSGNLSDALSGVIKYSLNRAAQEDYCVQNQYVTRLYDILTHCRGSDFDREALLAVVKQCREAMNGFQGWYMEAQNAIARRIQYFEKLKDVREVRDKLRVQCNNQKIQIETIQINLLLTKIDHFIEKIETTYHMIKRSPQWRIGSFIVRVVERVLFRKKGPLVTEHLDRLFAAYAQNRDTEVLSRKRLRRSANQLRQIKKDFDALFASARWKLGAFFMSPRLFLGNHFSAQQRHVALMFEMLAHEMEKESRGIDPRLSTEIFPGSDIAE